MTALRFVPALEHVPAGTTGDPVARVRAAIEQLAAGRPVLLVRESEQRADLVATADTMTPLLMAFLVRHSSGFVCVALDEARADALNLPPQTARNQNRRGTAFAVSVDAAEGVSTGISATDRCRTVRLIADAGTVPADLTRPGHVVPVRAVPGGVLRREGHTEAAVDLAGLAGGGSVAVLADVVLDGALPDGAVPGGDLPFGDQLEQFAATHGLVTLSVADLVTYRWRHEPLVRRAAAARVPTVAGEFLAVGYESSHDDLEHVAFVHGHVADLARPVPVHIHRESLIGDAFGALVGSEMTLSDALERVVAAGHGVVVYLRSTVGAATGVRATLDRLSGGRGQSSTALVPLAGPVCSQILADLGVREVDLLNHDRALERDLGAAGVLGARAVPRLALADDVHTA